MLHFIFFLFKAKILAHHDTLQGKLQELLSWVSGIAESLDGSVYHHATDANSLSRCLQRYKVTMAMPLILLADGVAVLRAEEKLLILLPSWSLPRVCPYPLLREEQQYCTCSKVICFHNKPTICSGHLGNVLKCRCVVGAERPGGIPVGLCDAESLLHHTCPGPRRLDEEPRLPSTFIHLLVMGFKIWSVQHLLFAGSTLALKSGGRRLGERW